MNPCDPISQDRHFASLTCLAWAGTGCLTSVWSQLTIRDTTLTRSTYNYGSSKYEVATIFLQTGSYVFTKITSDIFK